MAAFVAAFASNATADDLISGRATAVDGVRLNVGGKAVRLAGVHAPAIDQTCVEWVERHQSNYPCGQHAKAFMMSVIADRTVVCVAVAAPRDGGKETFVRCYANGTDVAELVTRGGWAVASDRTSNRYITAQEEARSAQRGLWAGQFDLPNIGTPSPSLKKVK
jgi:endonuclease YncB( thermonuclease family)